MLDLADLIITSVMTGISVFISSYAMFKIMKKQAKKEGLEWITSEQAAKIIYQMGAIAAQGAKAGFGLQKTGGKFQWQDMLGRIVGGFIEKKFGMGTAQENIVQQNTEESMRIQ